MRKHLFILFLMLTLILACLLWATPLINKDAYNSLNCRAKISQSKITSNGEVFSMDSNTLIYLSDKNIGAIRITGFIKDNNNITYRLNRYLEIKVDKRSKNGIYHYTITNDVKRKDDNVDSKYLRYFFQNVNEVGDTMQITSIGDGVFLFNNTIKPDFVCNAL
ncbi:hypothetical protein [Enterobacter bugandensis]|uniref:hypothetical protein n=1 Tax=Enterobacter bugandensis TaxID=881260 RepID=UPI0013D6D487|nr:hypothetical protein [Enterobacter bugandensis]